MAFNVQENVVFIHEFSKISLPWEGTFPPLGRFAPSLWPSCWKSWLRQCLHSSVANNSLIAYYSWSHYSQWDAWRFCRGITVLHSLYAVKAQTSLAPLSWFPGSRIPTAHVHQCCRFQSYAKSRRLHAIANETDKRKLQSVNHIPGIHDNGPPVTSDLNIVLTQWRIQRGPPTPRSILINYVCFCLFLFHVVSECFKIRLR